MFKVIKLITTISFWNRVGPNSETKNAAGSYSEVLIYRTFHNVLRDYKKFIIGKP